MAYYTGAPSDSAPGNPWNDLEPAVQSREREQARRGLARGEDDESAAGAARASIGEQRQTRSGTPDDVHTARSDDQRSVGLGGAQDPVRPSRSGQVEPSGKHHLDDAEPEVVGHAAQA